ncbi:hypothetical protein AGOR_G00156240 [Albula goreensis]|uniref:TNFR-Cys domain-containing protein n=1 Tax=Albula goreensis TaxID=1534307 RepID=A0A8T3D3X5_9TELE|nr:hypothetical protein AGOR_G00156240 [Albula goreensis]
MKLHLGVLLLLAGFQGVASGGAVGCATWSPSENNQVCCTRCKQGNHMVNRCGVDPSTLCEPCDEGYFVNDPTSSACSICTQCTGKKRAKQDCTSSSDTVCECKPGYLCRDTKCSSCDQECGKGQQPTANWTCQDCPYGTFNNKIHSKCVPWSTKCPHPDQKIVKKGTMDSDIVCEIVHGNALQDGIMVAILFFSLSIIIFIILSACIAVKKKKKSMIVSTVAAVLEKPITVSEGLRQLEQQEECIYCLPQQEQGSSLESVASLDSEVKLLSA